MNWRHELKFVTDEATFHHLYFMLRPVLHIDRHANGSEGDPGSFCAYRVRSLYFDDDGHSGVFDKLSGIDKRHKYRIRIYNDNDQVIHLEKKIKRGDLTRKYSCRLSRDQVECLLAGEPEAILDESRQNPATAGSHGRIRDSQLIMQFYSEIRTRLLVPKMLVDYERIPLTWPDGNVRLTFDRLLSCGLGRQDLWDPDAAMVPVLDPGQVIMEVKFDHFLPDFIRSAIQLPGVSPLSISKYVLSSSNK